MRRKCLAFGVAVFLLVVSCHHTVQTNAPHLSNGAIIEGIEVRGNRAISTDAMVARIQTKAGDKINTAAIQRDIRSLRSLGFEDVRVGEDNGANGSKIIIFFVQEKVPK